MSKKESKKTVNYAAIVLLLLLLIVVLIAGTYARYISTSTGTDKVRVAKWSFKIGDNDITTTDSMEIDLFSTILDSNGSAETDVTGEKVIAPGTQGKFAIETLKNESEVTADYALTIDVGTSNIPLEFSLDNGATWKSAVNTSVNGSLAAGASTTEATNIMWRWAFSDGTDAKDTSDTALGIQQATGTEVSATVTLTLTATQAD